MEKERDKQLKVSIILKYSLVDDKPIQEFISFSILSFSPWQTSKCMPLRGKYDSNLYFVQPYINLNSIHIPFIKQISSFYMEKKIKLSPIVFILSSTYAASSRRSHKSRYQLQKDRFSESSHSQPYPGAYIGRDESYHQSTLSYPPFLFTVSCFQEGIYSHYSVQGSWIIP